MAYCFFIYQKYFDPSFDEILDLPLPDVWSSIDILVDVRSPFVIITMLSFIRLQVFGQFSTPKRPFGRVIVVRAPLELPAAQDTVFHHVLRGRSEEIRARLAVGLLDDVAGPPSRVRAV